MTPQATPTRACERHDNGAFNPEALVSRFSTGTRQFSNQHSDVRDIRRLNFPSISLARNPGASFSTTNPPTRPSSSFAHTNFTSAMEALPIQHLLPSRHNDRPHVSPEFPFRLDQNRVHVPLARNSRHACPTPVPEASAPAVL